MRRLSRRSLGEGGLALQYQRAPPLIDYGLAGQPFQGLELFYSIFPTLGKIDQLFSKHRKKKFQPLENAIG